MNRYQVEQSCAVYDAKSGIRTWHNSFQDAVDVARKKNDIEVNAVALGFALAYQA